MFGAIASFAVWLIEKFLGGSKPDNDAKAAAEGVELQMQEQVNAQTLKAAQNVVNLNSRIATADSLRKYESTDPNNRDNQ